MAETQYTSTLTGPELDEALRDAAGVDAKVEQAQNAAQQAAQSASSAQGYASAASGSASQASTSAGQASESAADASGQADAAAESARQAAASAASIEGDVEQASSSASAAAQSATQAAASASAAEDAAERAEQIADFNPADFATSAQGTKADTAVQSVNGKTGTAITLGAADVGAATTAQGAKADTAVQPDDLSPYAKTADLPDNLPNPYSLSIRFNGATQATYNGSSRTTVNITPNGIGAATSAQGAKADAAATAVAYTITVPSTGWTSGSLVWGGTTYTRQRTVTAAQATANPTTVLMEYAGGDYASYCTIQLLDTQDGSVVLWAAADPEESCQIKVTEVRAGDDG